MAGPGAVANSAGAWAWAAWLTIRATGLRPSRSATEARVRTRAAAPSEIELALAAVIAPSLAKAGFRVGMRAGSARPGCSSRSIRSDPFRPATSTATISRSKAPEAWAARARSRERMAKASMASRPTWWARAVSSAKDPISRPGS